MPKYNVIVSERADKMTVRHIRFLAKASKSAAVRLANEFEAMLDELEANPYQFPAETDENLPEGTYTDPLSDDAGGLAGDLDVGVYGGQEVVYNQEL